MIKEIELEEKRKNLEKICTKFIEIMDINPKRSGLVDTPKRFAKYWIELLEGQFYSNQEIAEMFNKTFEEHQTTELVIETDIPIFSTCEHHVALMYDMKVSIGYIPNKKVIGLSKMARIAEMAGKRLQLQERICDDIREIMEIVLGTKDIAVIIIGKHSCLTARGVKSREAVTKTASLGGKFLNNASLRNEFYSVLKL